MVKIPLTAPPAGQPALRVRDNFLIADYPRGTLRLLVTFDQLVEKTSSDGVLNRNERKASEQSKYLQVGAVACPSLPYTPKQLRTLAVATAKASAAAAADNATEEETAASAAGMNKISAQQDKNRNGRARSPRQSSASARSSRVTSATSQRAPSAQHPQRRQPSPLAASLSLPGGSVSARTNSSPLAAAGTAAGAPPPSRRRNTPLSSSARPSPQRPGSSSRRPPLPSDQNPRRGASAAAAAAASAAGGSVLHHLSSDETTEQQKSSPTLSAAPDYNDEETAAAAERQFIEKQLTLVGLKASAPVAAFDGGLKVSTHKPVVHSRRRKDDDEDVSGGLHGGADMNAYQLHACEAAIDIELDHLPADIGFIFVMLGTTSPKQVQIRHASNVRVRTAFVAAPENPHHRARMHTGGTGLVDIKNGSFAHFILPGGGNNNNASSSQHRQVHHNLNSSSASASSHHHHHHPGETVACLGVLERISATRCGRKVRNELAKMALQLQQRQEAEYEKQLAAYLAANKKDQEERAELLQQQQQQITNHSGKRKHMAAALLLGGVSNTNGPDDGDEQQQHLLSIEDRKSDDDDDRNAADDGGEANKEHQVREQQSATPGESSKPTREHSVAFVDAPDHSLVQSSSLFANSGAHLFAAPVPAPAPAVAPVPPPKPRLPIGWVLRNLGESDQRPYLPVPTLSTCVDVVKEITFEKLPRRAHFIHQNKGSTSNDQQQQQQHMGGAGGGGDDTVDWMMENNNENPQQQQQQQHQYSLHDDASFAPSIEEGRRAAHALGHRWEAWNSALQAVWQRHEKLNEVERWVESHSLQPHMRQPAHPPKNSRGQNKALPKQQQQQQQQQERSALHAHTQQMHDGEGYVSEAEAARAAAEADQQQQRQQQQQPKSKEDEEEQDDDDDDDDGYEWSSDEEAIADECFVTLLEEAKAQEALVRCPSVDSEEELVFEQHHRHKHHHDHHHNRHAPRSAPSHPHHATDLDIVSSAASVTTTTTADEGGADDNDDYDQESLSTATTLSDRELNDVLENAFCHGSERELIVRNGRRNYSSGVATSIQAGTLRWGSVENPDAGRALHLMHRVDDIQSGAAPADRHEMHRHKVKRMRKQRQQQQQQQQQEYDAELRSEASSRDSNTDADVGPDGKKHLSMPGITGSVATGLGFEPRLADALPRYDADRVTRYGTGCYNLGTKPEDLVGTYLRNRREYTTYARKSLEKVQQEQQDPLRQKQQHLQLLQQQHERQQRYQHHTSGGAGAGSELLRPQTAGETVLPRLRYTSLDSNFASAQALLRDGEADSEKQRHYEGMQFLQSLAAGGGAGGGEDGSGGAPDAAGGDQTGVRRPNNSSNKSSRGGGRRGGYGSSLTARSGRGGGAAGGNSALNELRRLGKPGTRRDTVVGGGSRSARGGSASRRKSGVLPSSLVLQAQSLFAEAPVQALRRRSSSSPSSRSKSGQRSPSHRGGRPGSSSLFASSSGSGAGGARHRSPSGRKSAVANLRRSPGRRGGRSSSSSSVLGSRAGSRRPASKASSGAAEDATSLNKDVGLKLINYDVPDLPPPIKFEDAAMNRRQEAARTALATDHDALRELIRQHDLGELMGHRNDDSVVRDVKKPRGDPRTIGLAKKLATKRRPAAEEVAEEERRRREAEQEALVAKAAADNSMMMKRGAGAGVSMYDTEQLDPRRSDVTVLQSYAGTGSMMACTDPKAFVRPGTAEIMHRTSKSVPGGGGTGQQQQMSHHHIPTDNELLPRPGMDVSSKLVFVTREALRAGLSPRPPDKPAAKKSTARGGSTSPRRRGGGAGSSFSHLRSYSARGSGSGNTRSGSSSTRRPGAAGSALASPASPRSSIRPPTSSSISAAASRRQQNAQMSPEQRRQAAANQMAARQEQRDLARDGAFASLNNSGTSLPHVVLKM